MVTGHNVHNEVRAAHIWKYCTRGTGLTAFGLQEQDVASVRNGLLLVTGLERAFGTKRMCFVYNALDQKFYVYILDPELKKQPLALLVDRDDTVLKSESTLTYEQLHLHFHLYVPLNKPFRRLLYYHAKCAFDYAKEMRWNVDRQQWKSIVRCQMVVYQMMSRRTATMTVLPVDLSAKLAIECVVSLRYDIEACMCKHVLGCSAEFLHNLVPLLMMRCVGSGPHVQIFKICYCILTI